MGLEIFVHCYGDTQHVGLSRSKISALFPISEHHSEPDFWKVTYDAENQCTIYIGAIEGNPEQLNSFMFERPCADLRLWNGILSILRMGSVVMFSPGSRPILAKGTGVEDLPADIVDALGPPIYVKSTQEIITTLESSSPN